MSSPIAVVPPACANWFLGAVCPKVGLLACSNCKLVLYCGPDCQKSHWPEHKKACRSPLGKATWRPAWDKENCDPSWASGAAATAVHNPFGSDKYLWGNMPAIDILQLEKNESTAYAENIALLFAASGDLRNVVKTIADLPTEFNHQLHVTINDREFEVVARNIILLLFALASLEDLSSTSPDHQAVTVQIAEILIHVWYSVFLPNAMLSQIQRNVKPLISQVCAKIIGKTPDSVLGKTWTFTSPGSTIRLVLRQKEWLRLEKCLDIPQSLTRGKARDIRAATMMAPERQDFRDRWYYKDATPFMRIAKQRFREDGLLLPFGHPTHVRGSIFPILPFSKHPTPGLQRTKQIH